MLALLIADLGILRTGATRDWSRRTTVILVALAALVTTVAYGYQPAEQPRTAPASAWRPQLGQPALVIWGSQDTVLPVAQAARFDGLLPSATTHVLDGCGHALTLDCPDRVKPLLEDFLA